jgi:hypothetical protein
LYSATLSRRTGEGAGVAAVGVAGGLNRVLQPRDDLRPLGVGELRLVLRRHVAGLDLLERLAPGLHAAEGGGVIGKPGQVDAALFLLRAVALDALASRRGRTSLAKEAGSAAPAAVAENETASAAESRAAHLRGRRTRGDRNIPHKLRHNVRGSVAR